MPHCDGSGSGGLPRRRRTEELFPKRQKPARSVFDRGVGTVLLLKRVQKGGYRANWTAL